MPRQKGSSNVRSEGNSNSPATPRGSRKHRAIPTSQSRGVTTARQLPDSQGDAPPRKGTLSAAAKKTVEPDPIAEKWLRDLLESYGLREIEVSQGPVKWVVKADGSKIGDLERARVLDRDTACVQRLLRLPVVVRVEIIRPGIGAHESLEALRDARKALNEELFEAGRLSAKYLTDLCQEMRWEHYGRTEKYSEDKTALATWAYQRIGHYEDERLKKKKVCFTGAVRSVLSQQVMQSFNKWRKSKYSEQLAVFTSNTILLRHDSWKLERTKGPTRWVVHFAISSERVAKKKADGDKAQARWHSVVISTNQNPAVHATLRKFESGEIKQCDAKLVWEKGNRCWAFRLVGMRERPQGRKGTNLMAIRRGLETPLFRLLASARAFPLEGGPYIMQKKGLHARKKKLQEAEWERGKGSRSHGRLKRKAARQYIASREANSTKTFIRQSWSDTIKLAKRHGVSTIVMEDFGTPVDRDFLETLSQDLAWLMRRFPWAEFKAWGRWACTKTGLRFVEVSAARRSHVCPLCKDESPENYLPGPKQLLCQSCGAHMPGAFAEAWNMMIRSGLLEDDTALRKWQRGWQQQMAILANKRKGTSDDESGIQAAE